MVFLRGWKKLGGLKITFFLNFKAPIFNIKLLFTSSPPTFSRGKGISWGYLFFKTTFAKHPKIADSKVCCFSSNEGVFFNQITFKSP